VFEGLAKNEVKCQKIFLSAVPYPRQSIFYHLCLARAPSQAAEPCGLRVAACYVLIFFYIFNMVCFTPFNCNSFISGILKLIPFMVTPPCYLIAFSFSVCPLNGVRPHSLFNRNKFLKTTVQKIEKSVKVYYRYFKISQL